MRYMGALSLDPHIEAHTHLHRVGNLIQISNNDGISEYKKSNKQDFIFM